MTVYTILSQSCVIPENNLRLSGSILPGAMAPSGLDPGFPVEGLLQENDKKMTLQENDFAKFFRNAA